MQRQGTFPMSWADMVEMEEKGIYVTELIRDEYARCVAYRNELKITAPNQDDYQLRMRDYLRGVKTFLDDNEEKAIKENESAYWKCRGAIFMESSHFDAEAIRALEKVVDIEPKSFEYWNYLGELCVQTKQFDRASACFYTALDLEINPMSYQNLSVLTRVRGDKSFEGIMDGIKNARLALELDYSSVKSWTILANSYMAAVYLTAFNDHSYIEKALGAFKMALKGNPNDLQLIANRFTALKYLERYQEALDSMAPAFETRNIDWNRPREEHQALVDYLSTIQELILKKGKIRPKKIRDCLKELKLLQAKLDEISDARQVEPRPSTSRESAVQIAKVSSSMTGKNANRIGKIFVTDWAKNDGAGRIIGRVIFNATPNKSFPFTCGVINEHEQIFILTIFNLGCDRGGLKLFDTVSFPSQTMTSVNVTCGEQTFSFLKVRIINPRDIIQNGKPIADQYCVPTTFVSYTPMEAPQ